MEQLVLCSNWCSAASGIPPQNPWKYRIHFKLSMVCQVSDNFHNSQEGLWGHSTLSTVGTRLTIASRKAR